MTPPTHKAVPWIGLRIGHLLVLIETRVKAWAPNGTMRQRTRAPVHDKAPPGGEQLRRPDPQRHRGLQELDGRPHGRYTGKPLNRVSIRYSLINLHCFFDRITEWG